MRSASAWRSSTPGPAFVLTADLIVSISSCFGQDDVGRVRVAECPELAAAHQAKALVRGDDPRFFRRQHVLLPEQLEDRRRHRRLAAVGVDFLAASGDQRAGRVEVAGDARRSAQPDTPGPAARSRWPGAGMFTQPSGASVSS